MGENTVRANKSTDSGSGLFSYLQKKMSLNALFEGGIPVNYLHKILFLTMIAIFYIANNHWAERMIRKIDKMQIEVEELRADYTSLKSEYMFASKQTEVARKVKKLGLKESHTPPNKIVDDVEY